MEEKYTLNWHTFSENVHLMFKDLYQDGKYADVTLVSDDQSLFKAHKIVLSAFSPVFKTIIDSNPSQHPLIYLRGIQSYEIESILQFFYLGEGKFFQERIEEFLKVAKDLGLKEIIDVMSSEKNDIIDYDISETDPEETFQEENPCQEERKTDIKPPRKQLNINIKHESVRYPCKECDYQATFNCNLQRHIQSMHEGYKFPCNYCDYQATRQENLVKHVRSKHEGIRYPCNQCNYQATQKGSLKLHKRRMHNAN